MQLEEHHIKWLTEVVAEYNAAVALTEMNGNHDDESWNQRYRLADKVAGALSIILASKRRQGQKK